MHQRHPESTAVRSASRSLCAYTAYRVFSLRKALFNHGEKEIPAIKPTIANGAYTVPIHTTNELWDADDSSCFRPAGEALCARDSFDGNQPSQITFAQPVARRNQNRKEHELLERKKSYEDVSNVRHTRCLVQLTFNAVKL